jgi:hypothetical protein
MTMWPLKTSKQLYNNNFVYNGIRAYKYYLPTTIKHLKVMWMQVHDKIWHLEVSFHNLQQIMNYDVSNPTNNITIEQVTQTPRNVSII